jgi:hypothetical protein
MNKIKNILMIILIIEALLINVVIAININRLWVRNEELTNKIDILEERINNIAISNRLQYEDLLDIIER